MAIKLWWDTNITLANTSFSCSTWWWDPAMIVSLFTVASAWNYHFEWNFTGNSAMTVALSINGTNKEIWIVIWTQSQTYDFTAEVWDVITLEASGSGSGSNLSVVRYADEIKEIYVWEWTLVDDYSAMRWPCPVGFHVPSRDEWDNINNIWLTLNAWTSSNTNILGYLKLPKCWYRSWSSSTGAKSSVSTAYFQTCTQSTTSNNRYINIYSSYKVSSWWKSSAYPIRPFKDTPVIPDSSWTVEYQWTGTAWIYSNATLWLISISSDGTNWTTISDKNLWATTAWNTWDTAIADNCWNYFQRWNNYWFAFSWSINVSSTKVDAKDYWPWNYYYSDTFITSNGDWSSVTNANLRWWVTWVQQKQAWNVTEVYVGTTKVRPLTN